MTAYDSSFTLPDADSPDYRIRHDGDGNFAIYGGSDAVSGTRPKMYHGVFIGQSNRQGVDAKPVISGAITRAYMVTRGLQTWLVDDEPETPENRSDLDFYRTAMAEETYETAASGFAEQFIALLTAGGGGSPNDAVIVTNVALGGRYVSEYGPLADTSRGELNGHWATLLDDLVRVQAMAENYGYDWVPLLLIDGLESEATDQTGVGTTRYRVIYNGTLLTASEVITQAGDELVDMAEAFDTAVKAIDATLTGYTFIRPTSYPLAHSIARAAADASALVRVSVPRYELPSAINASNQLSGVSQAWGDWIHLEPDGQRWGGMLEAIEAAAVLIDGDTARDAVHPVSAAKVSGTQIDITFSGNIGALEEDITSIAKLEGWGFADCSGAFDSLSPTAFATAISFPSANVVRITVPAVSSPSHVRIGHQSRLSQAAFGPITTFTADAGDSADGFQLESVAIAGDMTADADLVAVLQEGAFYLYKADLTKRMTVRDVSVVGGETVFTGEARESTGSDFAPGDTLRIYRMHQGANVRDGTTVDLEGTFAAGPREGDAYGGRRWIELTYGISVSGS